MQLLGKVDFAGRRCGGDVVRTAFVTSPAQILTGGASLAVSPFSKDELAGAEVVELAADPMAANPAMTDLRERLGTVATEIYRRRASQVPQALAATPEQYW